MDRILEYLLRLNPGELGGADSLVPTFAAGYNNWVILAMVVGFAILVALTIASYLREGDAPRRTKLTIAAIRIVALVLIFSLLLEPGVILRHKKNYYSSVVVLVDDSLSMSLADRYADPGLRNLVAGKVGVKADDLAKVSRTEIVRKTLTRQRGPLAELARDHPLILLRFSTSHPGQEAYTQPLDNIDVCANDKAALAAATKLAAEFQDKLKSGGYETNLAAALRDAADRCQGQRVAGLVLVSDGQMTSGNGSGEGANRLSSALAYVRQRGIPVFAVGVGDPQPPQNVEIIRLQGPNEVRKGASMELTAYLTNRNCGGQTTEVRLFRRPASGQQWADTGVVQQITLAGEGADGKSRPQEVVLRADAPELEAGQTQTEYVYKAQVKPLPGEANPEEHAATAKIIVSDQKVKILIVSGDGGWEFQYLRNLLLRSPDTYAVSVWQQDAEKEFNQEASTGMRLTQLPRTRNELFNYEVVILHGPAFTDGGFDGEFAKLLEEFVSSHHGGLCYVVSRKNTDDTLAAPNSPFEPLVNLLPVTLDREAINIADKVNEVDPTAWPVLPTVVGLEHPVLRLAADLKDNLSVWDILPGIYWSHPVARVKPLGSVLTVSKDTIRRTTDSSGEMAPLIAVQYYGKGRVMYMGIDETWRWRAVDEGSYYRKFWTNMVDFLASGRLQNKRIIITTGSETFAVGEEMRVHVEAYDRDFRPLEDDTFQVEMVDRATGALKKAINMVRMDKLDPSGKGKPATQAAAKYKGHYEALETLNAEGTFDLTAKREQAEFKDAVLGKTINVTLPKEEFRRREADLATLKTIAPENRFLMITEAEKLPKIVPSGKITAYYDQTRPLWDVPLAVVIGVLLLASEWILRKKHNMA